MDCAELFGAVDDDSAVEGPAWAARRLVEEVTAFEGGRLLFDQVWMLGTNGSMAIPGESSTMSSLGPELDTSFCFLLRRRYHQNSINKISTATPPTIPPMIGPTGLWLDFSSLVEEFGMLLAELVEGEEFVVAGTKEVVVVLESVTIGFVTLTQLASEDADTETMLV